MFINFYDFNLIVQLFCLIQQFDNSININEKSTYYQQPDTPSLIQS